jgi:hypothetical protein
MDLRSKLPKSFGVRQERYNTRWKECVDIMNNIFNSDFTGSGFGYLGVDVYGRYEPWDSHEWFDVTISVDEFFQIIELPTEINNYQIY